MASESTNGSPEERVREIVEEVLRGSPPLFLVDVSIKGRKGSQVVDVFLESDEVLDVEALARVSREVGFLLETREVFSGAYHLNVSSPGVDRPLLLPRQFRKNVGRKLKVKYREAESLTKTVEGTLREAGEDAIVLGTGTGSTLNVPFADLVEARVQLPW